MEERNILDEYEVIPPERVDYAGFWIRVGASLIDALVMLPIIGLSFYNLFSIKSLLIALMLICAQAVYKPFMEYQYGATIGKMATKLKVVSTDFQAITLNQTILRDGFYLLGFFANLFATFKLYQHPEFVNLQEFTEIATLQAELGPDYMSNMASLLLFAAIIFVAFDPRRQGLHDKIAETYCIHEHSLEGRDPYQRDDYRS